MLYITFFDKSGSPLVCFHPSRKTYNTLLLLWLNGSPSCSSLIKCFYELGPWKIYEKGTCNLISKLGTTSLAIIIWELPIFQAKVAPSTIFALIITSFWHQGVVTNTISWFCYNQIIIFLHHICRKHRKPYI